MGKLRRTRHIPKSIHQGQIHILGPFNSGTNLLRSLLQKNIQGGQVIENGVWKHTMNQNDIVLLLKKNPRNIILIMYRPLASWIAGVKKAPYDLIFLDDGRVSFNDHVFSNLVELYNAYLALYQKILQTSHRVVMIDYYKLLHPLDGFNYLNEQLKRAGAGFLKNKSHYLNALMRPSKDHGSPVQNYVEALEKRKALIDDS